MNKIKVILLLLIFNSLIYAAHAQQQAAKKENNKTNEKLHKEVKNNNAKLNPTTDKKSKEEKPYKTGPFIGISVGAGMMYFTTDSFAQNVGGTSATSNKLCANTNDGTCPSSDAALTLDYSAKLGFQVYFNRYNGIRAYVSYARNDAWRTKFYGYSSDVMTTSDNFYRNVHYTGQNLDFNIDYMAEIAYNKKTSLGLYVGVYAGYTWWERNVTGKGTYTITQTSGGSQDIGNYEIGKTYADGMGFGINGGVSFSIVKHHRIDVNVRFPIISIDNVSGAYQDMLWRGNSSYGIIYNTEEIAYHYMAATISYLFIF